MELKDIAAVSGKGGLFKIVSPTRTGVILESIDEKKKKLVAGPAQRVTVLHEISMYTTDAEGTKPLQDILFKIKEEFDADLGLDGNASKEELFAFLKHILPEFDEEKVYPSDIKKLILWYGIIYKEFPEILEIKEEEKKED